jgi:hypothetical protein
MREHRGIPRGPARDDPSDVPDVVRRRTDRELEALRETVDFYRVGASQLAARVARLRAEVARLNAALHADRTARGVRTIEVTLTLDEYASEFAGVIVATELSGSVTATVLEDVQLVACELTAGSVRRHAGAPGSGATLRVVHSRRAVLVSVEDRAAASPAVDGGLSIVERLSERWGTEHSTCGGTTVWAEVPAPPAR